MKQLLIDTASIHHAATAIKAKINYEKLVENIIDAHGPCDITFFVDESANTFINYIKRSFEDQPVTLITNMPIRKKIGLGERVWYLSFAVEMAMSLGESFPGNPIIVSTDTEIRSILRTYKDSVLYGVGIPKILRDLAKQWFDIPSDCLNKLEN